MLSIKSKGGSQDALLCTATGIASFGNRLQRMLSISPALPGSAWNSPIYVNRILRLLPSDPQSTGKAGWVAISVLQMGTSRPQTGK